MDLNMIICQEKRMNLLLILVLVNLLLHISLGQKGKVEGPRIIGGTKCKVESYPFVVTIVGPRLCGGSLLTLRWVLTAAHCIVHDPKKKHTIVKVGFTSSREYVQFRFAKKNIVHKKFDKRLNHAAVELRYDIGLVYLDQAFYETKVAKPVRLPTMGAPVKCTTAKVLGVGQTKAYLRARIVPVKEYLSKDLRCTDVRMSDVSTCGIYFPNAKSLNSAILFTISEGRDACPGDSGGPLLCKNVIIGIISLGKLCGTGCGTYTKVESYLDFIKVAMRNSGTIGFSKIMVTLVFITSTLTQ